MAEITKYNVYLNESQNSKLNLIANAQGKDHEEIINNSVYSYLLIADPFAEEKEPPQDQTEIMFYISDEEAAQLDDLLELQGLNDFDADDYAKALLLAAIHPEKRPQEIIEAIRSER